MALPPDPSSPAASVDPPAGGTVRKQFGLAALIFVLTGVGVAGLRVRSQPLLRVKPPTGVRHAATVSPTRSSSPTPTIPAIELPVAVAEPAVEPTAEPARRSPPASTGVPGDCSTMPAWFPEAIAWRESNCRYDVASAGGVYFGAYQIADFHWQTGACSDLDWTAPADQDECAWRLSSGGTDFSAWGA